MRDPVSRPARPVRRPSLLQRLRLSDGRLAWPVAQAAGISEATFRARLNAGLSPDDAACRPVVRQSPKRRRPVGGPAVWPDPGRPDGSVMIWSDGAWLLDLSPRGFRYAVRSLGADGLWHYVQVSPSAAHLRSELVVQMDDLPPALWAAIMALPDDPTAYRPASASVTGD